MKMKKMITPAYSWPHGIPCLHCNEPARDGDAVLAAKTRIQGTILFHKGCLAALNNQNWPESQYDKVRQEIIENPELVFG